MNHKELWKSIFEDTDKYIDFYFKEKAKRSVVYSKYEREELVSMAFFTPYEVVYRGEENISPFIVGVATTPEYRHRGYMRMLLEHGLMAAKGRGSKLAFLSPADEKIYEPLGFVSMPLRKQIEVVGHKKKWYSISPYSRLETEGKKQVAEFSNAQLHTSELDLYIKRSPEYYDILHKERKALNGKVLALGEGGIIRGVASYTHEEECYEITEVICAPEDGMKVVESICAYLAEADEQKVIFCDGYFLDQVSGPGITVKKEERPYVMLKALDEDVNTEGLKVYINDIT